MKRPGDTKRRPPGGGAAGRAQQFDVERGADKPESSDKAESATAKSTTTGASKKTPRKGTARRK